MVRPLRAVEAVSDWLRISSRRPGCNADVDEERTGVGGVGLFISRGAVDGGGFGMGVDGEGGTLNLALAGEPFSPAK